LAFGSAVAAAGATENVHENMASMMGKENFGSASGKEGKNASSGSGARVSRISRTVHQHLAVHIFFYSVHSNLGSHKLTTLSLASHHALTRTPRWQALCPKVGSASLLDCLRFAKRQARLTLQL